MLSLKEGLIFQLYSKIQPQAYTPLTMQFISSTAILTAVALASVAQAFHFRFYDNGGCDHSSPPGATWPPNSQGPDVGDIGACYSAPLGTNWNRLEIDNEFLGNTGVVTYCNVDCQGGETGFQRGTFCYTPVAGCAIGSFRVFQ